MTTTATTLRSLNRGVNRHRISLLPRLQLVSANDLANLGFGGKHQGKSECGETDQRLEAHCVLQTPGVGDGSRDRDTDGRHREPKTHDQSGGETRSADHQFLRNDEEQRHVDAARNPISAALKNPALPGNWAKSKIAGTLITDDAISGNRRPRRSAIVPAPTVPSAVLRRTQSQARRNKTSYSRDPRTR